MSATGRWVFVKYADTSTTNAVHESYIKNFNSDGTFEKDKLYEVFYSKDRKQTAEMLLESQGKVLNIDDILKALPENSPEREEFKDAAGYYYAKILIVKESHAALKSYLSSKDGRKLKCAIETLVVPECSKPKEISRDTVLAAGAAESKRKLLENEEDQNKKAKADVFDYPKEDELMMTANSIGFVSAVSLEEQLSSVKYRYSEELRKCKEESQKQINELSNRCKQLEREYDVVANRESSEAYEEIHSNYKLLEQTLSKSTEEYGALANKYRELEAEHSNLKVEHATLKNQFNMQHERLMKVLDDNVQMHQFLMSRTGISPNQSFSNSPSHDSSQRVRHTSFSSTVPPMSPLSNTSYYGSPSSASASPYISGSPSPISASPSPLVSRPSPSVSPQNDVQISDEQQQLPPDQITESEIYSPRPLSSNRSPIVPNVNMFPGTDNEKFNRVSEQELYDILGNIKSGAGTDTAFIRQVLIIMYTKEKFGELSWSGRGKTKADKKEPIDLKARKYLENILVRRFEFEEAQNLPVNRQTRINSLCDLVRRALDVRTGKKEGDSSDTSN